MSEMALTADHVVVIGRGRLIADAPVQELITHAQGGKLRLVTSESARFQELLVLDGATVCDAGDGALQVSGVTAHLVGELARDHGFAIYELTVERVSLEEAFMALTHDSVEYNGQQAAQHPTGSIA
jgi:ABC-2 type transport system ATP-binding protein